MNIKELMKQASQMQKKMADIQDQLADKEIEANSGAGMVKVVVNGKGEVVRISIDPEIINKNDKGMLEDLVTAAVNDGIRKSHQLVQDEVSKYVTGGMKIPGLF